MRPDVAIFDARLPDGSGIDVCRDVRSVDPSIAGLILTSFDDETALATAILAGAAGFLLKDIKGNGLVEAIRKVAAGENVAQGMTNRQIGEAMFLAEKTVKNYVTAVLAKLGMERRTQAAVYVTTHGR